MLSKHKEVAAPAREEMHEEKKLEFNKWERLPSQLQKHTEPFFNCEELIALSQTSHAYRQSTKEVLLKRLFPDEFARIARIITPKQKIDFANAFKTAYQQDMVNTQEFKFNRGWVEHKSNARHQRLLRFCIEGRFAEIKKEEPVVTIDDLSNISAGRGHLLFYYLTKRHHQEILNYFYAEMLKLFPEHAGIHYRLPTYNNFTLLHCAVRFNQINVVMMILAIEGADVDVRDQFNQTPLWVAATTGHNDIVKLLLDKKANPNAANNIGRTPLNIAAEWGHCRVAKLLLERKANINQPNNSGITPLTIAAYRGHYDVVVLLLRHGANITLKGGKGKTAFEWATDPQIKKVLLIAELDLFLQSLPTPDQKFFHKTAASVSQLKKALSDNNFAQVEKLNFSTCGQFGKLYKKALEVVKCVKEFSRAFTCR